MTTMKGMRATLALMTCAAVLAACGSSSPVGAPPPSSVPASASPTESSSSQHSGVSPGETAALAAELLPVTGFSYVDVPAEERDQQLASLPEYVSAMSVHGVADHASGEEVAFLVLSVEDEPGDAMYSENYASRLAQRTFSAPDVTAGEFSGHEVWASEDASRPMSRYQYLWQRHGTLGYVDGPDRSAVEGFLTGYFAAPFRGAEAAVIGDRMVDLPGYSYTNAVDRSQEQSLAEQLFPGSTASMHYVFDRTHMFGGLVLVGPVTAVADGGIVQAVGTWFAKSNNLDAAELQRQPDLVSGTVTVHRLVHEASGMNLLAWRWSDTNVVGWLATSRPDLGEEFVKAFVLATPGA